MTSATSTAAAKTGVRHAKEQRAVVVAVTTITRGVTTLMYASQQGDVNKIRKIIKNQPTSLYSKDRTGKTPLHYCTTSDNICAAQAADILVMAAPDLVESHDEDGFTPLHLAVIAGNMPLVTFLLANNADVNAVDNEKHTVVHWAAVCGETGALRAVLAAGAPVSTPDVHGGYPLHYAAQMCGGERDSHLGVEVLQTLLTHSDIIITVADGDGRQPLLWAASAGSAKAVLSLVRAGASVEAPDKDGLTALHCAASRGHTDCIDSLLTLCGASPDVIDSNGCTALHYAVTLGHADATALLLAHGADPNRQDRKGRSPAHCGCAKGQFETVKMIGAQGANLWLRNARGDLPLHEASASGRRDLVKWLLELRPSQVNARNNDGRCPLHLAALNDNADMCKILLDAGSQINPILRTSKNVFMTPLDCALQRGFRSTAKYLQLHGGVPASRLGDLKNQNGLITTLQIRDDVTFWGDTSSDSERENGETKLEKKIKHRKKLIHKFEKKRQSLSGSDPDQAKMLISGKLESAKVNKRRLLLDQKNQNGRSSRTGARNDSAISVIDYPKSGGVSSSTQRRKPSGRFDYTNEIIINGKTEINIHQSKEFKIGKDTEISIEKSVSNKTVELETEVDIAKNKSAATRPKSSKSDKSTRDKSGKPVKGDGVKKVSATESKSKSKITAKSVKSGENTEKKIKDDAGSNLIQAKAEEKEVDEALLSKTELQEVSVLKGLDHQSFMSNTSEDVDGNHEIVVEAAVHSPPISKSEKNDKILSKTNSAGTLAAETTILEELQKLQPDVNGTEEEKNKVGVQIEDGSKTAISEVNIQKDEKTDKATTQVPKADDGEGSVKVDEPSTSVSESQENVGNCTTLKDLKAELSNRVQEEELDLIPQKEGSAKQRELLEKAQKTENEASQRVEQSEVVRIGENQRKDEDKTEEASSPQMKSSAENGTSGGTDTKEVTFSPDIIEIDGGDQREPIENKKDQKHIAHSKEQAQEFINQNPTRIDGKVTKSRLKKKQKKHRKKLAKSEEKAYELIDKTFPDEDAVNQSKAVGKKVETVKFKENEVDEHTLPTGEEDENSSDLVTDEGTTSSSTTTPQKHKSFRVLDESERSVGNQDEPKKRSILLKKQRSKSEENQKSTETNQIEQKLRRSKIPTPLIRENKLSKSDKYLNTTATSTHYDVRKVKSSMDSKVPSLPNIHDPSKNRDHHHEMRSQSNMSAPLLPYSDAEGGGETRSDLEEEEEEDEENRKSATNTRRKKVKRRTRSSRSARSARSDYESSNLIDSGFEPSPRSSRIPKAKDMSERGVNMTSVTQTIQTNIRRFHLERKIFQHLLDLKRLQIRSGQHNEAMLVKRAIDSYHRSCASTVGGGRYVPDDFTFKSFEKFLYYSLRKIQKNGAEYLKGLPEAPSNPLLCTQSTHRCMHATHAYTGIPCAAYLPKMDHHTIPKIGFGSPSSVACKPGTGGFLPTINQKKSVTLELSHGNDRQIISLPADRLDQNKRYFVTFTVKGDTPSSSLRNGDSSDGIMGHQHPKSD